MVFHPLSVHLSALWITRSFRLAASLCKISSTELQIHERVSVHRCWQSEYNLYVPLLFSPFTEYVQGPMSDAKHSFLSHLVPILRNRKGNTSRLAYLPTVTKSYAHPDLSESKASGLLTTASATALCSFPPPELQIASWDEWAPPELQGLQPNSTNVYLQRSQEAKYKKKNEGNRMLSINTSKLLFLSLKNSLVIVFASVNHKNESPQIFKRNFPSKYVNFVPWIHLLWDHMMPPSTAFYLNVTFFHSVLISHLKNHFYQSFIGAKHNCVAHWNIKYRLGVLESN